jgi:hypothetical protein
VSGCPREHLEFHLWYLKAKGWIARLENGMLAITVEGVDRAHSEHRLGTPLTDASEPHRLRIHVDSRQFSHALCSTRQGCLMWWGLGGIRAGWKAINAYFGLGAADRGIVVVRFGWLGSARILVYGIWPDFPADS